MLFDHIFIATIDSRSFRDSTLKQTINVIPKAKSMTNINKGHKIQSVIFHEPLC